MNYRIEEIPQEGILVQGERPAEWLESLFLEQKDWVCSFVSPLSFRIRLSRSDFLILVAGVISLKVELSCSRCLGRFIFSLSPEFEISLTPTKFQAFPLEMELKKEDLDVEFYNGEIIDLRLIIQNQIILALPFNPICREDCKGLCSQCGVNKNVETCTCVEKEWVDPRLSALKNFFKK